MVLLTLTRHVVDMVLAPAPPQQLVYRPPQPEVSDEALYVDGLLNDRQLRLGDCESHGLFEAFRDAIQAESSNTVAVALLLLKLGNVQRDIAEGVDYALGCAAETHRRAIKLFATSLTAQHPAVLKARYALARTLIAKGDMETARYELQSIIDFKFREFAEIDRTSLETIVVQENRESVAKAAEHVSFLLGMSRH